MSRRKTSPTNDTPVANLVNMGPTSAGWLARIGVLTRGDLERLGAVVTFRIVRQRQPKVSWNLLYAMHGALLEKRWDHLPKGDLVALRLEAQE